MDKGIKQRREHPKTNARRVVQMERKMIMMMMEIINHLEKE